VGLSIIEVPRSTSQASCDRLRPVSNDKIVDGSALTSTTTDSVIKDTDPLADSSVDHPTGKTMTPVVMVTNTLTNSQKLQYDVVSVASTSRSRRSSLPEMMDVVNPNLRYTGESSTIPNETPVPKLSSSTAQTPASVMLLSSSPPITAANRKLKRAKSEVGLTKPPSSVVLNSSVKIKKRKGRRKTIAPGEKPPVRETSVDELSLPSFASTATPVSRKTDSNKRASRKNEDSRTTDYDDHVSSDEIGLEGENHQPKSTLRRSHIEDANMPSTDNGQSSKENDSRADVLTGKSNTDTVGGPAMNDDGGLGQPQKEISALNISEAATEIDVPQTIPPAPTQPRKRGRPRKNTQPIPDTSIEPLEPQRPDTNPAVLHEIETNKLPSAEPTSTPASTKPVDPLIELEKTPTKLKGKAVEPAEMHTPTRDTKKGPDQHSPLQSGKVPYRVGLSKRTRIAPLLKMIRK
jgi:hypothetical protein